MNPTEQKGINRTGIKASPANSDAMQQRDHMSIGQDGDEEELAAVRTSYIVDAEVVGSMPQPLDAQVLLDKLGERMAFERTGTRLYDALITKCRACDSGLDLDELQEYRDAEARHFLMLADAITALGGDPTAQTPSADMAGVEAMGLVQVMNDPRATVAQSLHALLLAEMGDKAGWETLIALADEQGHLNLIDDFTQALNEEREHLDQVQAWYEQAIGLATGGVVLTPEQQQNISAP
jgi:hypothetical protein